MPSMSANLHRCVRAKILGTLFKERRTAVQANASFQRSIMSASLRSRTGTSALTLQSAARNMADIPEVHKASRTLSTHTSGASGSSAEIRNVPVKNPTAARTSASAMSGPANTDSSSTSILATRLAGGGLVGGGRRCAIIPGRPRCAVRLVRCPPWVT